MKKFVNATVSSKPRWFMNSWFDTTLLIGFPTAFLTVPLIYYLSRNIHQLSLYVYIFTNFPHVLSGLLVAYLVQKEYKKQPVIFLVIPLILFIGTLILYARNSFHFDFVRLMWGKLHICLQYYFLLAILKIRYNDSLKIDKIIDTLVIIVVSILIPFAAFYRLQIESVNNSLYGITFYAESFGYIRFLVAFVVLLFILRQVYLLIYEKEVKLLKNLFILMFSLICYYPLGPFKNNLLSSQAETQFHNVQYIAWVWLFCRIKYKNRILPEFRFISYLAKYNNVFLYFIILICISIIQNFFMTLFVVRFGHNRQITCAFALIHFYIDWLIWRSAVVRYRWIYNEED